MLDSAVTWFGITIENALSERVKVQWGKHIEYKPRYTLALLLEQGFKLPKPPEQMIPKPGTSGMDVWGPLLAWAGKPNSKVRRWAYKPPAAEEEVKDG